MLVPGGVPDDASNVVGISTISGIPADFLGLPSAVDVCNIPITLLLLLNLLMF